MQFIKKAGHWVFLWLLRATVTVLPRMAPPAGAILVLAPHPDDEVLGVGGLLLATVERSQPVHVVYLTNGEAAGTHLEPKQIRVARTQLTHDVMKHMGIPQRNLHRLHLPDGGVPRVGKLGFEEALNKLVLIIDSVQPDLVLTTHTRDYWPYDHVACAELAIGAISRSHHRPDLYGYWVWAWYHARPWRFWWVRQHGAFSVDISPWHQKKQVLIATYLDAKTPDGLPWSGILPYALRRAFRFRIEILERIIVK